MFDFIHADDLECPYCRARSSRVTQQSRIADQPDGSAYYIGDRLPLPKDGEGIAAGGYIAVRPEAEVGARIRVLELWGCYACGRHTNVCAWVFEDQVLVATDAVELSGAAVLDADFVTDELPMAVLIQELQRDHPSDANEIAHVHLCDAIDMLVTGKTFDEHC